MCRKKQVEHSLAASSFTGVKTKASEVVPSGKMVCFVLSCCIVVIAAIATAQAQVNCMVHAGWGEIDLSQIPQKWLQMTQMYDGVGTEHLFKFNLCNASTVPPKGAENCNKTSFVGEWGTNGGCEAQIGAVMQQPLYRNGVVSIVYVDEHGWTAHRKYHVRGDSPRF